MSRSVPVVSLRESLLYNLIHIVPFYLRGIFAHNRFWYNLWSRFHPDPLGLRFISRLRKKYQSDYLYLYMLTSKSLLVLDPAGIQHILAHSPTIYADAKLKRKGMAHFQPHALTISRGEEWAERRHFNEAVLNSGQRAHAYADFFLTLIRQELNSRDFAKSELGWDELAELFERISLQILFGKDESAAPVAEALSQMMRESNRVFALRPSRHFKGFYQGIRHFLANPRAQSLAYLSSATPSTAQTRVENQIPHWLFAMKDTLVENVVPTLALIISQPQVEARVRQEMANADLTSAQGIAGLRYLEACIEETMRLWPTTPMLVRESVAADSLEGVAVSPGTQVIILNSFTHRDEQIAGDANRFLPERWLNGQGDNAMTAVSNHFSSGPQVCAGKDLALFVAKAVLATLLSNGRYLLVAPELEAKGAVPQTFNPFLARFQRRKTSPR